MNKTRFYEILKAYKNEEDLSQFIPTNNAEAQLLANLIVGSGSGSTGGEPSGGSVETFNVADVPTESGSGGAQQIADALAAGKKFIYYTNVYNDRYAVNIESLYMITAVNVQRNPLTNELSTVYVEYYDNIGVKQISYHI